MKNNIRKIKEWDAVDRWKAGMVLFTVNCITYYGTRLITTHAMHHSMKLPIDDWIPFCPFFISVYIVAFVQWGVGFYLIIREGKENCCRLLITDLVVMLCCLFCYLYYPTTIVRPEIEKDGIWGCLTVTVYRLDRPDNLFPSLHCAFSWICFRGAMHLRKIPKWYLPLTFVFSLLVFASTVFVKQHVVMDMAGAVIVVELGLFLSGIWCREEKQHG